VEAIIRAPRVSAGGLPGPSAAILNVSAFGAHEKLPAGALGPRFAADILNLALIEHGVVAYTFSPRLPHHQNHMRA